MQLFLGFIVFIALMSNASAAPKLTIEDAMQNAENPQAALEIYTNYLDSNNAALIKRISDKPREGLSELLDDSSMKKYKDQLTGKSQEVLDNPEGTLQDILADNGEEILEWSGFINTYLKDGEDTMESIGGNHLSEKVLDDILNSREGSPEKEEAFQQLAKANVARIADITYQLLEMAYMNMDEED